MKKLLGILIACLLLSGNAYAGLFDKDKIKVTKCWDPTTFNNYKAQEKEDIISGITKWEWQLNLKTKIAIRTTIINGQLSLDQFLIGIITDDYIIVKNTSMVGDDIQFDLQNKAYITTVNGTKVQYICKFNQ